MHYGYWTTCVGTRNRKNNLPQDTDTRYRMMLF